MQPTGSAHAASQWTACEPFHFGPTPPDRIFVNVYMRSNVPAVLGLSSADIQAAISEATNIWNEQVSAAVVLRWAGLTSYEKLAGAIVVNARADVCSNTLMWMEPDTVGTRIIGSYVEIRKYTDATLEKSCIAPIVTIPWSFVADVYPDIVATLLHEFGHGVGFIQHPLQSCPSTGADLTSVLNQESIMDADGVNQWGRTIRAFDKHRFADMYAQRSLSSTLRARYWSPTTNTWGPVTGSLTSYVAHRPGVSQGGSSVLLEWFNRGGSGTRGVRKARWVGYLTDIEDFGTDQANQSEAPGAIAINPTTGTAIAVYQRRALTALRYGANSQNLEICYRFSTNYGQTFGGPQCLSNITSPRYGVGVGYEPFTSRFIISYSSYSDGSLVMLTFPSGSESAGLTPTFTTLNNQSLHGGSVACRMTGTWTNECRVAYQDKITYQVRWLPISVSLDGYVFPGTTYSLPYTTSDMPSIAFWTYDQTYRLVFKGGHYANYSYKSLPTQTAWTFTGDIVNNFNVAVSTAVLATTPDNLMVFYVQQW